jgi:hypothetical protein
MKTVKINNLTLEIYDSIEEMPIVRHHKFNKMLMIDSGIGSDLSAFDMKLERIMRFIKDNPEHAQTELLNLRQCISFIQNEISPKHLAFCALVKSIDGKEITDISDDGMQAIHERLKTATDKEITSLTEEVKKKNRTATDGILS